MVKNLRLGLLVILVIHEGGLGNWKNFKTQFIALIRRVFGKVQTELA